MRLKPHNIYKTDSIAALGIFLLLAMQVVMFVHAPAHVMERAGALYNQSHTNPDDTHPGDDRDDHGLCDICFVGKSLGLTWLFVPVYILTQLCAAAFHQFQFRKWTAAGIYKSFQSQAPPASA